jgi:hypothetical protein
MASYEDEEAIKRLENAAKTAAEYPQGEPYPVAVTLTDEHWAAVIYALISASTVNLTKGGQAVPMHVIEQMIEASRVIQKTVIDLTKDMITNTMKEIAEND